MAKVTPQEFAEKWGRRLKAAGQDITRGIDRVQQAPGVKAAQQAQVMLANLQARIADGSWARAVAGVSLADWQNAAKTKGVARITQGVDGAMGKMNTVAGPLLAAVDAAKAAADRTPRGDLNTNIQRAVTFMTEMAARAPKRQK